MRSASECRVRPSVRVGRVTVHPAIPHGLGPDSRAAALLRVLLRGFGRAGGELFWHRRRARHPRERDDEVRPRGAARHGQCEGGRKLCGELPPSRYHPLSPTPPSLPWTRARALHSAARNAWRPHVAFINSRTAMRSVTCCRSNWLKVRGSARRCTWTRRSRSTSRSSPSQTSLAYSTTARRSCHGSTHAPRRTLIADRVLPTGTYVTPASDSILESITNKMLMQLATARGMKVEPRAVSYDELSSFSEVRLPLNASPYSACLLPRQSNHPRAHARRARSVHAARQRCSCRSLPSLTPMQRTSSESLRCLTSCARICKRSKWERSRMRMGGWKRWRFKTITFTAEICRHGDGFIYHCQGYL